MHVLITAMFQKVVSPSTIGTLASMSVPFFPVRRQRQKDSRCAAA